MDRDERVSLNKCDSDDDSTAEGVVIGKMLKKGRGGGEITNRMGV